MRFLYLLFCTCLILTTVIISKRLEKNSQNQNANGNQEDGDISKNTKNALPKSPSTDKDKSNAHNFVDAALVVDPRTGSLSFSLTVGHLITGHRRFQLKLRYSQTEALAGDDLYGFGVGWSLSIPWLTRRGRVNVIIHMGDGSKYTIEGTGKVTLPIQYYDTRDVNVSSVTGELYTIEKKGDIYLLDGFSGRPIKITTREGFTLNFKYTDIGGISISNGIDSIFNLTDNGQATGKFMISQTSMGTVKYETQRGTVHNELRRIICHSCKGPDNTFHFHSEHQPSKGIIKKIEYPSGLIEDMKYVEIGGKLLGVAYGVSQLTRTPGTNVDLLDRKAKAEVQMVEFDYDPLGTGHNFLGDGFAFYHVDKDSLLETNGGFYEYVTKKKHGNTCTFHYFDKMHLKTKMKITECDKPSKIWKETVFEYPCLSNYSYENMTKNCKFFTHYMFPKTVTNQFFDEAGIYTETTRYKHDEYGKILSATKPTGEVMETIYNGTTEIAGKLRLPLFKSHKPAPGADCLERVVDFHYKPIRKLNAQDQYYDVERMSTESYMDKAGGKHIITATAKTYYTDENDLLSYGRVKTITKSENIQSSHFVTNSYEYKAESGTLTTIITTTHKQSLKSVTKSTKVDMSMGLKLEETKTDKSKIIHKYDLEGRVTDRILRSTDKKDKDITVTYEYHREKNRNSKTTTYADGRIEISKFDNAKHALEKDVFDNKKPFAIHGITYNKKWQISKERKMYKNQANPKKTEVLETKLRYDVLDRIVEKEKPNGVTDMTKYDANREGKVKISYMYNKLQQKQTIPKCTVEKFGKIIRKSQLLGHKHNLQIPCSSVDSLHVELSTYDGFNRLHTQQTVSYKNKSKRAKEITTYNAMGFLISKETVYEIHNLLNTHFHYNTLFKKAIEVYVKLNHVEKSIATRTLDGFGRDAVQIYEGVETNNTYNTKNQLVNVRQGYQEEQFSYDGFGRKRQLAGNLDNDNNARVNVMWEFLESGKADKIQIKQGDKSQKMKEIKHMKKYHYDKILGLVNVYKLETQNAAKTNKFCNSKIHDLIGRIISNKDFLGYKTSYNYSLNGELEKMTIKKKSEEYLVSFIYDDFGQLQVYKFEDNKKSKGFGTFFQFDKYRRLSHITFKDIDEKQIGTIIYKYDNFDQMIQKTFNDKETEEKYSYDSVGRIKSYSCNEYKKNPQWGCPKFTDGLKPSPKNSHTIAQQFNFDQMNNIVSISMESNEKEKVNMIYNYAEDKPTVLESVVFQRENMPQVKREVTQRLLYDRQGNVKNMVTEGKEDYIFKYDSIGHMYQSVHNEHNIEKHHDEKGNIYYHQSRKGSQSKKKLLLHDDKGVLRTEWSSSIKGSYMYVSGRKTAWLSDKNWNYYCLDDAGSVISSLGPKGNHHFTYSPFGCNYRNVSESPIGFQNMWTDEDDLIVAENGRTFAPWIGRFLQRDPLSPFGDSGIEGYVFAGNSPISGGDPTGEMWLPRTAGGRNLITTNTLTTPRVSHDERSAIQMRAAAMIERDRQATMAATVTTATAEAEDLVSVSELGVDEIGNLMGSCGHCMYAGAVEQIYPDYMINKLELVQSGSGIESYTIAGPEIGAGVHDITIDDVPAMFERLGPRNLQLVGPLNYQVSNAGSAFGTYQAPQIENMEQTVADQAVGNRPHSIVMTANHQYTGTSIQNPFGGPSHTVAIGRIGGIGSMQSGVTGIQYNVVKDMAGMGLDSYLQTNTFYRDYFFYLMREIPLLDMMSLQDAESLLDGTIKPMNKIYKRRSRCNYCFVLGTILAVFLLISTIIALLILKSETERIYGIHSKETAVERMLGVTNLTKEYTVTERNAINESATDFNEFY